MWDGQMVELQDWSEFGRRLACELKSLGYAGKVAVRNFSLQTYDLDEDGGILGSVDRLALVKETGTDRDVQSPMWNAVGHDYQHDIEHSGKSPSEIIYAYVAETKGDSYLVHYQGEPENMDLTQNLTEHDGILIYDATGLTRVAKNEHWFMVDPREALLLVFTLVQED